MARRIPRHYFEPSAILAWLKREEVDGDQRWWHCLQLLEQARRGESIIVTSGLTLAEVTGGKGKSRGIQVPAGFTDFKEVVRAFFENEYVEIVEAGRVVGELARQLIWDFPTLDSFDATHLASALDAECDVLYTYDSDLLKLAGAAGHLNLANNADVRRLASRTDIFILRPRWDTAVQTGLPEPQG